MSNNSPIKPSLNPPSLKSSVDKPIIDKPTIEESTPEVVMLLEVAVARVQTHVNCTKILISLHKNQAMFIIIKSHNL